MPKFQMDELIGQEAITARLGAGTGAGQQFNDKDKNKLVKMVGDSRYDLCAVGDEIEGRVLAVNTATQDGYSIGSVQTEDRITAVADGIQADGTGSIAVRDFVVAGTPVALNTAITEAGPRVRKATDQAAAKTSPFAWRVVAIKTGNGSVGSTLILENVN